MTTRRAPDGVCELGRRREARRTLEVPVLRFKGSGWYVNDYGKKHDDARKEE